MAQLTSDEIEAQCDEAAYFIHDYCVKWGRLGGQAKSKYGSVRFYVQFASPYYTIQSLIYPGDRYIQWSSEMRKVDEIVSSIIYYTGMFHIIYKWQSFIYRRAYKLAVSKWSQIKERILDYADYPELLVDL